MKNVFFFSIETNLIKLIKMCNKPVNDEVEAVMIYYFRTNKNSITFKHNIDKYTKGIHNTDRSGQKKGNTTYPKE